VQKLHCCFGQNSREVQKMYSQKVGVFSWNWFLCRWYYKIQAKLIH